MQGDGDSTSLSGLPGSLPQPGESPSTGRIDLKERNDRAVFHSTTRLRRCEKIAFLTTSSFQPAWIGGLEKVWSGTSKTGLQSLSPDTQSFLFHPRVSMTSDDPRSKASPRRLSMRVEAHVSNFFTPSQSLRSICLCGLLLYLNFTGASRTFNRSAALIRTVFV